MANCFGCLNRPSFFLQSAAADAGAAAALCDHRCRGNGARPRGRKSKEEDPADWDA